MTVDEFGSRESPATGARSQSAIWVAVRPPGGGGQRGAERDQTPERRGKLRAIASFLADTGREFAAEVAAKVIIPQTGMGRASTRLSERRFAYWAW